MRQTVGAQKVHAQLPGHALLWLVVAFFLLLIPQFDRLPIWLLAVCASLAGWRWLVQVGHLRLPGKWFRIGLTFALVGVYIATVNARFTVDTAASFFVMAVGLKWLETRSPRDFYVLFFILIYLASVNFLFGQSVLWALINVFAVLCLLIGLQILNAPSLPRALFSGWRRLVIIFVKTLPIVIVLFVFFPRIAPLWSVPLVSGEARTGISDRMTPGDISSLAQSSERAFRASFEGEIPPHRDRYWRGLVLDTLDGETWLQGAPPVSVRAGRVAIEGKVGALETGEYDVLMEPTNQSWAYALDHSVAVSDNVFLADNGVFRLHRPADTTFSYRLQRMSFKPDRSELPSPERQRYLQLPRSGNPNARALAQELKQEHSDPWAIVSAIIERFRTQPYYYTLRPPGMPSNGVDELLFEAKRGFCAHYAGATTFLLRAAGVPARVVVGYQGGELGANDAYLIVRQYDAHAWVEAWLPGNGWIRIDPTAAISPARIESGLRDAVAEEGSFLENNWTSVQRYGDVAALRWTAQQLDKFNYQWQRWVVGYQGRSQLELMSRLPGGFGLRELGYITAGIIGATLLLAGLVAAWTQKPDHQRDPYRRVIHRWHGWLNRQGVNPGSGETPEQLAMRQADLMPDTKKHAHAFARQINNHYYGIDCPGGDLAYMKRLLRSMRKLTARPGNRST